MIKSPRHYAAEIIAMDTRQERVKALRDVPDEYRNWVEDLVKSEFGLRKFRSQYL